MRLWHIDLLNKLDSKRICGQWREVVALLGLGWGKKHSVVDYVFTYPESYLIHYAHCVYEEMVRRGYNPDKNKIRVALQKRLKDKEIEYEINNAKQFIQYNIRYPEHNHDYLNECVDNLKHKGIEISVNN